MDKFYCLVVGSRSFQDYPLMVEKLDKFLANYTDICIVSGGAKGADELAEIYALERDYELKVMKADWARYGRSAGHKRNVEMNKFISQFEHRGVVAFWDGKSSGTQSNFEYAKKYNNPIKVVRFDQIEEEKRKAQSEARQSLALSEIGARNNNN